MFTLFSLRSYADILLNAPVLRYSVVDFIANISLFLLVGRNYFTMIPLVKVEVDSFRPPLLAAW